MLAPKKIDIKLPIKRSSIVFTSEKPTIPFICTVISKYKFPCFNKLSKILPESISQEYFLEAICDLFKIKEIMEFTPYYCYNGHDFITIDKLSKNFS